MTTKYRKGYRFEDVVRKKLEKEGYYVVRSSGSKGVFDLIAFPPAWHVCCPDCGSKQIEEIKPNWGICYNCESNFYMIPKSLTDGKIMGIQCKVQGRITKAQKEELIITAKRYGIYPYLATRLNKHTILIDLENNETIPL